MRKKKQELNPEQGKRLSECLADAKMSQKMLAELSGYTQQYVNYICCGKKNMSIESAEIFASKLNVQKEYLLCKSECKSKEQRADILLGISSTYDNMIKNILFIAHGIEVDGMGIAVRKHKQNGIATEELKLLLSDDEIKKNTDTLPDGFPVTYEDIEDLIVKISFNGTTKIIKRDILYNLQKDIMDYAEFKCRKFTEKHFIPNKA